MTSPTHEYGDTGRLRDHASRGAMWSVGVQWSIRVSGLVTFVVLGRLLAPADFGAIALASTLVLILSSLADFGFAAYLVQASKPDQRDFSTAFWFSGAMGTLLAAGLYLVAWPLADLLNAPDAAPVVAAVSLSAFLDSFKSVPTALLKRRFDFRALALRRLVAVVLGQVVAIAMAVAGAGVWALVGQVWTVSIVSLVLTWAAARWLPSWRFSPRVAGRIARYGVHVLGSDLVYNGSVWATDAIVSRFLGLQQLGYLVMANRVVQMTVDVAAAAGQQVAVALFASVKQNHERLTNAYLSGLSLVVSVLVPGMLWLVVSAPLVVPGVLGEKWEPAVPVFQLIGLSGIARAVGVLDLSLLLGTARPRLLLGIRLLPAVLLVGTTTVTAQIGVVAVAAGFAAVYALVAPVQLAVVSRAVSIPLARTFGRVLGLLGIGAAAVAPAVAWTQTMTDRTSWLVVALVSLALVAVAQMLLLRLLARPVWTMITGMAGGMLGRRPRRNGKHKRVAQESATT
jgi:O-antigen/teichoic acid export membrane protein